MIGKIYLIGCFIAFLLGMRLLYKEERKKEKEIQYGMLAPLTLMSWISVFIILWKIRDKLI
jgi:hypothetical protein